MLVRNGRIRMGRVLFLAVCLLVGLLLVRDVVSSKGYHLAFSQSESVTESVFWVRPHGEIDNADFVMFQTPPNPYADAIAIKKIVGRPGDEIIVRDRDVWVSGRKVGTAKPLTRKGQPLTVVTPGVIPEGYVFVAGTHKDSFDSRYAEFGFIQIADIKGYAKVLF